MDLIEPGRTGAKQVLLGGLLLWACAVNPLAAFGGSVTVRTFSDGSLAAKATFEKSGTDLIVTFKNISTDGACIPEDVLTAVYFDLADPDLTGFSLAAESAVLPLGSSILNDGPVGENGDVGSEYGFRADLDMETSVDLPPWAGPMVISAVGLGDAIGAKDLFPFQGDHLYSQDSPNGIAYGIVSWVSDDAVSKLTTEPLVQDTVVFTLSGLPSNYDLEANIRNVAVNYGTDFNPVVLPLPSAALLGALGLGLVGLWKRSWRSTRRGS